MVEKAKKVTAKRSSKKKSASKGTSGKPTSKKTIVTKPEPINVSEIHLLQGKGSKGKGGDKGGHYWHIYVNDIRAGFVFINWIDEQPFGEHASIQIKVNTKFQNQGIGRVAYKLACEASQYDTVFAHMRKSNIASKKAAEAAGFQVVTDNDIPQLAMIWNRPVAK